MYHNIFNCPPLLYFQVIFNLLLLETINLGGIYMVSYMGEYIHRINSSRTNVSDGSVRKAEASLCSSGVKGFNKGSEGLTILGRSWAAKVREEVNGTSARST